MRSAVFVFLLYALLSAFPVAGQGQRRILDNIRPIEAGNDILKPNETGIAENDSARQELLRSLKQHWIRKDIKEVRRCLVALSAFCNDPLFQEQALRFAKRGLQLCDSQKHAAELSLLYENIGQIYFRQSRYKESFESHLKAIAYTHTDPLRVARIERKMSETLLLLGYPTLALDYLERTLHTAISYRDGELWASALLNISRIKEQKNNLHFPYWDSCVQVARKFKLYSILYAATLNKSSSLALNGKPQQALHLLQAFDTLSAYLRPAPLYLWKKDEIAATAYSALGQYDTAEQLFLRNLNETDHHGWLSSMNQLNNMYVLQGDFKKAFYTAQKLRERIDSIGSHDMRLRLIAKELQYKNAEKDKELLQKEAAIRFRNTWIGIVSAGALILLGIILLLRRNYLQKQKIQRSGQINLQLKARIDGEELERERVSRELHDGIGGILSAAKMNLSSIRPPGDPLELDRYEKSVQLIDDAYIELRRTAHNMSPEILKDKGLIATVALFCKKTEEVYGMPIRFQHFGMPDNWHDDKALSLYRIIQELVQNIVKHSGARKAMVQLSMQDNRLELMVEDRGKGMEPGSTPDGIGLGNIRNRVAALGGYIDIDSRKDEGTTVYIGVEHIFP